MGCAKSFQEEHPMSWEVVIGLEIHTQLSTNSKIFSGSDTTFGAQA
jgi:aspartyl-tRNA(Asn)/glutamyl-tRNA(Gln) amidotransferase subunit B